MTQQVVYPQEYFTQTSVTKDESIVSVIQKVETMNSQVVGKVPTKVTIERIDDVVVYECCYEDLSITVVQEEDEELEVLVVEEIPEEIEVVTVEVTVNEEGEEIITSNKIDKIAETIPQVRTAIIEVSQMVEIRH